jgi:hypothetical protein
MTSKRLSIIAACMAAAVIALGACGGSSSKSKSGGGGGESEAASAASGDIPDNQVFLTFRDRKAGYSLSYPEGWSRRDGARDLTFRDKDNSVHLAVAKGGTPSPATVRSQLAGGARSVRTAPKRVRLRNGLAIKAVYAHLGPANPVTGKRPLLLVDRYVYARGHYVATLDLSTPKGVDNVDAYRMIANSFRWR